MEEKDLLVKTLELSRNLAIKSIGTDMIFDDVMVDLLKEYKMVEEKVQGDEIPNRRNIQVIEDELDSWLHELRQEPNVEDEVCCREIAQIAEDCENQFQELKKMYQHFVHFFIGEEQSLIAICYMSLEIAYRNGFRYHIKHMDKIRDLMDEMMKAFEYKEVIKDLFEMPQVEKLRNACKLVHKTYHKDIRTERYLDRLMEICPHDGVTDKELAKLYGKATTLVYEVRYGYDIEESRRDLNKCLMQIEAIVISTLARNELNAIIKNEENFDKLAELIQWWKRC